jgi:hypothetical protein
MDSNHWYPANFLAAPVDPAGAIDDRAIAGEDAGTGHALALDADREGRGRMLDKKVL